MIRLKVYSFSLFICIYLCACSSAPENPINLSQHTQQCQQDNLLSLDCPNEKKNKCIELPYYNDRNGSLELLTFILHAEKNSRFIKSESDQMQILFEPSAWKAEYSLQVTFFDDHQVIHICSDSARDWFGYKKNVLLTLQQKYLNVSNQG